MSAGTSSQNNYPKILYSVYVNIQITFRWNVSDGCLWLKVQRTNIATTSFSDKDVCSDKINNNDQGRAIFEAKTNERRKENFAKKKKNCTSLALS